MNVIDTRDLSNRPHLKTDFLYTLHFAQMFYTPCMYNFIE